MKNAGRDSSMRGLPTPAGGNPWPDSPWSLIHKVREGSPQEKQALQDRLFRLYYKPVYRFFQRVLGLHAERLQDITQDFFTRFVEKDFLKSVKHEKSFRNFLKVACRRHYINWLDAERVRKEPGGKKIRSLHDEEGGTIDVPMPEERTSQWIDEELRTGYLQQAIQRLQERLTADGKEAYFQVFEARTRFDDEKPPEYQEIARHVGRSVYDVRNYLSVARKTFKEILVELAAEGADDPKGELRDLGLEEYL